MFTLAIVVVTLVAFANSALARRRVVVLDFVGARAERFHSDVTQLIKRVHTIVETEKWNHAAESLGATKSSADDIARVAGKLDVDAVVSGQIEKRRSTFIVRIKVRDGRTGELIGNPIEVVSAQDELDGNATRDLNDELMATLEAIEPSGAPRASDDSAVVTAKEKPHGKAPTKVAKAPVEPAVEPTVVPPVVHADEEVSIIATPAASNDRRHGFATRPVDLNVGLSVAARRLTFDSSPTLVNKPQGYSGAAVAGVLVDATIYPAAFDDDRRGFWRNVGVSVILDRVIKVDSSVQYSDNGNIMTATLPSTQERFGIGIAGRYPLGTSPDAPEITGKLRFNTMFFTIDKRGAPAGATVDIPNVVYHFIEPALGFKLPISSKFAFSAELAVMLVTDAGAIEAPDQYGGASVLGFDGDIGAEYMFSRSLFGRLSFRFTTVGFSFVGNGAQSQNRDGEGVQDVSGARDTYLGGAATVGYLF